jgi:hypothetical protein
VDRDDEVQSGQDRAEAVDENGADRQRHVVLEKAVL